MMMKPVMIAVVSALACLPAQAISRYNAHGMSCEQTRSTVASEGAVILRYPSVRNRQLTLYDRYVAHRGYCQMGEYARLVWIPTADSANCPVYKCDDRTVRENWRD